MFLNKRIEYVKSKNPELSLGFINDLSNLDPTKELKYLVWIVGMFKKNEFNEKQFNTVSFILKSFEQNKNKLPQDKRDLNRFNSILELSTFLLMFEQENKVSEESFLKQGAKKIYEDNDFLVVKPLTMESSIKFGKGTTWCTASTNSNNRFHQYAGQGDLFIFIDKKEEKNKKQFHFSRNNNYEFKNSSNQNFNYLKFFKEYKFILKPLLEYENVKTSISYNPDLFLLLENPNREILLMALRHNPEIMEYIEEKDDEVQNIFAKHYLSSGKESFTGLSAQFLRFFKLIEKPNKLVQKAAILSNPNLITLLQEKCGRLSLEIQDLAFKNSNNSSTMFLKIHQPYNEIVELHVYKNPNYIKKIKKPTQSQQVIAVTQNPLLIKSIKNPNKKAVLIAIEERSELYNLYKDLISESELIDLLKMNGEIIKYITNPNEELQFASVEYNHKCIRFIANPTKKIKEHCNKLKKDLKEHERQSQERSKRVYFDIEGYNYKEYSNNFTKYLKEYITQIDECNDTYSDERFKIYKKTNYYSK